MGDAGTTVPTPATAPIWLLPDAARQALLAYLGVRPYNEVAGGMEVLLTLAKAPDPLPPQE